MKDNDFNLFENPDDELLEHIAEDFPVLTSEEKDRLFAMSERKFNINHTENPEGLNADNETGDQVSGVDNYNTIVWRKYISTAAAIVLLAGGIGGSIAIGRHMQNNKPQDNISTRTIETTTAETTVTLTTSSSATTSLTTSTTSTSTTTTAATTSATKKASEDNQNIHYNAIAESMVQKYRRSIDVWKFPGLKTDPDNQKDFQLNDKTLSYIKVNDTEFSSPEEIKKFLYSVFLPEQAEDRFNRCYGGDLTEKINNNSASIDDLKMYITYEGALYSAIGGSGHPYGDTVSITAESVSDKEILAHWSYEELDHTGEMTIHIVWVDEYNDWRIDDAVSGSQYFGTPDDNELENSAAELFSGFADVYNAMNAIDVGYDESDTISFELVNWYNGLDHGTSPIIIKYSRVADERFNSESELREYINTKFMPWNSFAVIGDISKYPVNSTLDGEIDINTYPVQDDFLPYVIHDGKLYVCSYCDASGGESSLSIVSTMKNARMEHDPSAVRINSVNGSLFDVVPDSDTCRIIKDPSGTYTGEILFAVQRDDNGNWKINSWTY